jgi:hypothetical protein
MFRTKFGINGSFSERGSKAIDSCSEGVFESID